MYNFSGRKKEIDQEIRISKQLYDQYQVENSIRIQANINRRREKKLVDYEKTRVKLMMEARMKKIGKSKTQVKMPILIKPKEPKKSVWSKQVQNDGTESIVDVKIGTKLPSSIKNMKTTKSWLNKTT